MQHINSIGIIIISSSLQSFNTLIIIQTQYSRKIVSPKTPKENKILTNKLCAGAPTILFPINPLPKITCTKFPCLKFAKYCVHNVKRPFPDDTSPWAKRFKIGSKSPVL